MQVLGNLLVYSASFEQLEHREIACGEERCSGWNRCEPIAATAQGTKRVQQDVRGCSGGNEPLHTECLQPDPQVGIIVRSKGEYGEARVGTHDCP